VDERATRRDGDVMEATDKSGRALVVAMVVLLARSASSSFRSGDDPG
jgi:hypothetical protein